MTCFAGALLLSSGCPTGDFTLPGLNQDPTANAGTDRTIDVGQRVTLDGLGSTDADDDPLTFSWQQRSGPSVTLDGPNTIQPSFVPVVDGFYEFALTVTDDRGGSDISVVRVFVGNADPSTCPRADAGANQTVSEGAAVRLRGGNSADPGGRPLTFEWFQLSGPQVSINGVFIVEPSFAAPQTTGADIELEFELAVTNDQGCSGRDTVVIVVRDRDANDPCNDVFCEDDGQFCNGVESCENGACVSIDNPCGLSETCDESTNMCEAALTCTTNLDCDDDLFCNGAEMCAAGECVSGTEPCSADDTCDESTDSCETGSVCTDDLDCDGVLDNVDTCPDTPVTVEVDDTGCPAVPPDPNNMPFELVVVAGQDPVRPGQILDLELTVTNPGVFDRTGVVLTLEYPDGLNQLANSLFDGSCPGSTCSLQEQATFNIGTLAAGSGRTFSLPPRVASDTVDGTIIDFNAVVFDAMVSQVSSTGSVTVNATRELNLRMVENVDPVPTDGAFVYTLTYGLEETSSGVLDGLLSMPVPDGTSLVSATGGGVLNGDVIEWSLGAIGPGQVGEVKATVQVNNLGEGSIIKAEATLEDVLTPTNRIRHQAATRVQNDIPLELVVVTSSNPVRPGETMDVELTVANTGVFDRADVMLTLEYPQGLNQLSNSLFDGACPGSTCSFQERATFNIGTLAAGAGFTFSLPIQVRDGIFDGGGATFEAEVSASNGDRMESGASFSVSKTRVLELALQENIDPVPSDGLLIYTLSYGLLETGSGVLDGFLSMPLPTGTSFVSATNSGVLNGNVIEWSLGAIGPGQSGEVQATLQVNNLVEGSIIEAEATLEDNQAPINLVRNQATTRVLNNIPLELAVVAGPELALPGAILDVVLTVTNNGAFDRTGVVLTLEYPDGLNQLANSLFDGICPGSTCSHQERAAFNIGTLNSGQSVFFSVRPIVAANTLQGGLIRFDAYINDNTSTQVIDADVVRVGS